MNPARMSRFAARFRLRTIAAFSALAAVVLMAIAPTASADTTYIYWTTNNDAWTGRANIDGTNPNFAFFPSGGSSWGIAANSGHVYWSVDRSVASGVKIGRADLDGSNPDPDFLVTTRPPYGLAINSQYIYWANHSRNSIGRANIDGTGAILDFITGINEPEDVAVDSNYIYWASIGPSPYTGTGKIGRANLDGTSANLNFITGASNPQGIAVTASKIYWSNGLGGIGRANLDGSAPTQSFIASYGGPAGIAVTSDHIYWAEVTSFRIRSANLDGTGVSTLVNMSSTPTSPYGAQPWGIAIQTVPSPVLPTLTLTAPTSATVGQSVSLNGLTVGGATVGQTFTLSLNIAGAGSSTSVGSVTGTAFPLTVNPTWTPSGAGSYTATLNLLDSNSNVVVTTSQVISVAAASAPGPAPEPTPLPAPTVAPIVPTIVPPADSASEADARTAQKLVIVKFAVQKSGRIKVVGGKTAWLPGHHAYFTNVTTDPKLVTRAMVRHAKDLARQYGGVYGGIVVGYKWHFPRIVAAYFD